MGGYQANASAYASKASGYQANASAAYSTASGYDFENGVDDESAPGSGYDDNDFQNASEYRRADLDEQFIAQVEALAKMEYIDNAARKRDPSIQLDAGPSR